MSFGLGSRLSIEIYEAYKELYLLYFKSNVIKSQILLIDGVVNISKKTQYENYLNWRYKEITEETFDTIKSVYDATLDSDLVSLYQSYAHLTQDVSLIIQPLGEQQTVEASARRSHKRFVHVGMFGLKVLKGYLTYVKTKQENNMSKVIFELAKTWTKEKSKVIGSTESSLDKEINDLFENSVLS